jgi:hypothetical protein
MSASYVRAEDMGPVEGRDGLAQYEFGDRDLKYYFCRRCGIHPFSIVASAPPDYEGPARPGDYRVNLGCVHDLDALDLAIHVVDGRSF